jgi:hypothetical protein
LSFLRSQKILFPQGFIEIHFYFYSLLDLCKYFNTFPPHLHRIFRLIYLQLYEIGRSFFLKVPPRKFNKQTLTEELTQTLIHLYTQLTQHLELRTILIYLHKLQTDFFCARVIKDLSNTEQKNFSLCKMKTKVFVLQLYGVYQSIHGLDKYDYVIMEAEMFMIGTGINRSLIK